MVGAMQRTVHLVDFENLKFWKMQICMQKSALIQPRTSPPKFWAETPLMKICFLWSPNLNLPIPGTSGSTPGRARSSTLSLVENIRRLEQNRVSGSDGWSRIMQNWRSFSISSCFLRPRLRSANELPRLVSKRLIEIHASLFWNRDYENL